MKYELGAIFNDFPDKAITEAILHAALSTITFNFSLYL